MTWADFQASVLAYLNRASTDVPMAGSSNLVVVAANMAKIEAQRRHNFKMARTQAFITSSMTGAALSTATTQVNGAGTAVPIKVVEQAWQYGMDGTTPRRYKRIPAMLLGDLRNEYGSTTLYDIQTVMPNNTQGYYINSDIKWYIQGTSLYLLGVTTPALNIWLDVIQWMPEYDGSLTDFFLTYHMDWMLLRTVDNLNRYLKEDNHVMVSQTDLEKRWTAVTNFDENFAEDHFETGAND